MNKLDDTRLEKALEFMTNAKTALIHEIAASQGKARMHAPTFAAVCASLNELEKLKPTPTRASTQKTKKDANK